MSDDRSPRFRLDLIIATLALLASASASIATVVQTRVVANQLSAAVWPYLSFTSTASPNSFVLTLNNDGLGPALIRNVTLRLDGRRHTHLRDVIAAFRTAKTPRSAKQTGLVSVSGFGGGTVIRPGADLQILRVENRLSPQIAAQARGRVGLSVCYCSILQKCWRLELGDEGPPREVAACDAAPTSVDY